MKNIFKLKDIPYFKHSYKIIDGTIFIYRKNCLEIIDSARFSRESSLEKVIENIYKKYKININELLFQYTERQIRKLVSIDTDIILYFNKLVGEAVEEDYDITISITFKKEQKRKEIRDNKIEGKKMEENKIKCPDHYKLNVSGVENGVDGIDGIDGVIKVVKKKMEENKVKCPDHYKLNVSGVENGVNDVIKAVKKKMDDNHIECDKLEFHWYSDAIEYLLRAYFKGQKESDLKKAISEIQFILDNKYL